MLPNGLVFPKKSPHMGPILVKKSLDEGFISQRKKTSKQKKKQNKTKQNKTKTKQKKITLGHTPCQKVIRI